MIKTFFTTLVKDHLITTLLSVAGGISSLVVTPKNFYPLETLGTELYCFLVCVILFIIFKILQKIFSKKWSALLFSVVMLAAAVAVPGYFIYFRTVRNTVPRVIYENDFSEKDHMWRYSTSEYLVDKGIQSLYTENGNLVWQVDNRPNLENDDYYWYGIHYDSLPFYYGCRYRLSYDVKTDRDCKLYSMMTISNEELSISHRVESAEISAGEWQNVQMEFLFDEGEIPDPVARLREATDLAGRLQFSFSRSANHTIDEIVIRLDNIKFELLDDTKISNERMNFESVEEYYMLYFGIIDLDPGEFYQYDFDEVKLGSFVKKDGNNFKPGMHMPLYTNYNTIRAHSFGEYINRSNDMFIGFSNESGKSEKIWNTRVYGFWVTEEADVECSVGDIKMGMTVQEVADIIGTDFEINYNNNMKMQSSSNGFEAGLHFSRGVVDAIYFFDRNNE